MNSKERFIASVNYKKPDRPLLSPIHSQPYVLEELKKFYGVTTYEEFQLAVGEDFREIQPKYIGPELKHFEDGSFEGIWGDIYTPVSFGNGFYYENKQLPLADVETVDELKDYRFPSADWYDYSSIYDLCQKNKDYVVLSGEMGFGDFMNGISFVRGVQQVLIDIGLEDPVYLYLLEKRFEFFYEFEKRILEAGKGQIDVFYFGEDLGTQIGQMISMETYNKLFAQKYKAFFDLAHQYGAKTMMHSCGSVRPFIPRLIELGLDILDDVQVDAVGMDIEGLHRDFYGKICFCGSMSVQTILPNYTPDQIVQEVEKRKRLFADGGIMIGPCNLLQCDMPLENFDAMCRAIGSIK